MQQDNRPLSPHLQIYRPQITSVLSILHRMTGVGLAAGAVIVTWWLLAIVYGDDTYRTFKAFTGSFIGQAMLFCWLWAFMYHALNGIRHMMWDTGKGIDIESATRSGWAVVGASALFTLIGWILI